MATKKAKPSTKKSTAKVVKTVKKPVAKKSTVTAIDVIKNLVKCRCKTSDGTPFISALVAEFIGTFLIVISILTLQNSPLYVGFALIGVVLVVGGISGAHLNPAMTIGAWITRKMCSVCAISYIIAQVLGAAAAWLVLNAFLNNSAPAATDTFASSAPTLFHAATLVSGKEWCIFFAELLGSAILAFGFATALRTVKKDKVSAAITYGFATYIALLVSVSVTSMMLTVSNTGLAFLNPAVALMANGLSWNIWPIAIYVLAPVIGGVAGFIIQGFLQTQTADKK